MNACRYGVDSVQALAAGAKDTRACGVRLVGIPGNQGLQSLFVWCGVDMLLPHDSASRSSGRICSRWCWQGGCLVPAMHGRLFGQCLQRAGGWGPLTVLDMVARRLCTERCTAAETLQPCVLTHSHWWLGSSCLKRMHCCVCVVHCAQYVAAQLSVLVHFVSTHLSRLASSR
jgi:hypothetical protein